MAKPISFTKRDLEKKKQEKRLAKQQKKEERKNSGTSSFEDMIAYVDENGVITDTPPTTNEKPQEIDISTIEVSTPRKTDEPVITEYEGRVEFFNTSKGYGFIKNLKNAEKYFFHVSGLQDSCICFYNLFIFFIQKDSIFAVMEKFEVHILGCGSALPTTRHFSSSQVVNIREKLFMIDCGEGAQLQLRRSKLKFTRLNHIFISHLHGDHCFGLMGLISTFGLVGRTATLHIHCHADLERILTPQLEYFCKGMAYNVEFHLINPTKAEVVYEDRSVTVSSIPLRHRIPTCGFLFAEKPTPNHIIRDMIDFYKVPVFELNRIKNGEDYVLPDGTVIPNNRLTTPPAPPRSYAYCSDTIFHRPIIEQIKGVNLLFHEATFAQCDAQRAKETFHTTAMQAGEIARDADVKQLLIGHFSARYEDENILLQEARSVFPNTLLAKENLKVTL